MFYYLVVLLLVIDGGEAIQKHLKVISSFDQIRPICFLMFQLHFRASSQSSETDHNFKTELSKSLHVDVSHCDDFYVTAYSQS